LPAVALNPACLLNLNWHEARQLLARHFSAGSIVRI
jgi:hypothetical protein